MSKTSTKIVFSKHVVLTVDCPFDDLQEAFLEARKKDGWLTITSATGKKTSINPSRVLYLHEEP